MGLIANVATGLLLSERLTLEAPAHTASGSGGWTDSWASQGTVNGCVYVDQQKDFETVTGGEPTTRMNVQILLDAQSIVPQGSWRVVQADGTTWELLEVKLQGSVAICNARKVA